MKRSNLELLVYPENPFNNCFSPLPGISIEPILHWCTEISGADYLLLQTKLDYSCRKLCLMWYAGEKALEAESDFYSSTIKEAPALFGEDAILLNYHLESFILLTRSALDIASTLFGWTLPDPFPRNRYDSFNKLVKTILKDENQIDVTDLFKELRGNRTSWLSILAGQERGRSLRDKIAHQTEFPLEYMELNPPSEKESAVVFVNENDFLPLPVFINEVRHGVVRGYRLLEDLCVEHLRNIEDSK